MLSLNIAHGSDGGVEESISWSSGYRMHFLILQTFYGNAPKKQLVKHPDIKKVTPRWLMNKGKMGIDTGGYTVCM